jgi:hypothetical protein
VQAVTPQTSVCYGPQVLGGTALLESSPTPNGPWTTVQSVTAAASFRPSVNSYVRLTATTQAGSLLLSDLAGSNSPLTTSTLISSGIPFASPSSTSAQQIFSFRVPPNYLPQTFRLVIEFGLNLTNNANVKTVNVLMNGASGTNIFSAAVTSFATFNGTAMVMAFDGANLRATQGAVLAGGQGGSTTALATLARDYINNETEFVISITKATGTDTAECINCGVRLMT